MRWKSLGAMARYVPRMRAASATRKEAAQVMDTHTHYTCVLDWQMDHVLAGLISSSEADAEVAAARAKAEAEAAAVAKAKAEANKAAKAEAKRLRKQQKRVRDGTPGWLAPQPQLCMG